MNAAVMIEKIPVGVSSCLIGEEVRFNGGHKRHHLTSDVLANYFQYTAFCPEVAIGMPTPREAIRIINLDDEIRVVGTKTKSLDVTDELRAVADQQAHWHQHLYGYIVKKDSPSCGLTRVKTYTNDHPKRDGVGIYTAQMKKNFPNMPIEEEGRLNDPVLRENFIQRVFCYKRWCDLRDAGLTLGKLQAFHAQHKYLLMSHDQDRMRALGRLLSATTAEQLPAFAAQYECEFMHILTITATRKNHVNVLVHLQGYLKRSIDGHDKQELCDTIEDYRLGHVPLIVPVNLLRHFFRKYQNEYINNSWYLIPMAKDLMLLNQI